jgi:hypothetical protein
MASLLVAFVRRWSGDRARIPHRRSLALGAAWGAAFHLQPALLPVLLGCLAFELLWSRHRRNVLLVILGAGAVCVPWTWRNYAALGDLFFIRSNFGLELRMGNHEQAAAAMEVMDVRHEHRHPRTHVEEARLLREVGEAEYMRRAKREALAWIRAHPGTFLRLTASRAAHFWLGPLHRPFEAAQVTASFVLALLGMRRVLPTLSVPQRASVLVPLVAYPLVYYLVAYMVRYTVPLSWLPALFAGAEVWSWGETPSTPSTTRVLHSK